MAQTWSALCCTAEGTTVVGGTNGWPGTIWRQRGVKWWGWPWRIKTKSNKINPWFSVQDDHSTKDITRQWTVHLHAITMRNHMQLNVLEFLHSLRERAHKQSLDPELSEDLQKLLSDLYKDRKKKRKRKHSLPLFLSLRWSTSRTVLMERLLITLPGVTKGSVSGSMFGYPFQGSPGRNSDQGEWNTC